MPSSRRSSSPEVAALRTAVEDSCRQLRDQTRQQARFIRSSTVGELTQADVERMAQDITAAARARLASGQGPSADPELQAAHRQAAQIMAVAAREAAAELHKAWRARQKA